MKVSIRPLKIEDAYTSVKWRNDPDVFRYTGNTYDHEITIESELTWIERVINKKDDYRCAIEVDGIYVGNIYLTDIHDGEAEYHIFIGDKAYWGKGVAKEASRLILTYAKEKLNLRDVILEVRRENVRAVELYKALGFRYIKVEGNNWTMRIELNLEEPLVAVYCLVYNHGSFLRECLDGFVMQKTNFRFVAIVHDDASTDKSAEIIREYAEKYPDIIKPIYETENQYSKHDGSLTHIMNTAIDATGAKYIAMCEGDDYWTNPNKLQKQVDVLETNPDVSMCYSDFETVDELNQVLYWQNHDSHAKRSFTGYHFKQLLKGNYIITATTMIRSEVYLNPTINNYLDYAGFLNASLKGKFYYINEKLACYRRNSNSVTYTQSDKIKGISQNIWFEYVNYYLRTPSVHRNFIDHIGVLSTIDAVLISQLRSSGDAVQRARDLLARHKVLWTTYPFGILLRVQNRLRKMIRKYAQRS